MTCDANRRMNALSSTTSTRGRSEDTRPPPDRADFESAVLEMQKHASAVITSRVLADDRDLRAGQRLAHRDHVAFADVDAARGHQSAEHARSAGDLRGDSVDSRAKLDHLA